MAKFSNKNNETKLTGTSKADILDATAHKNTNTTLNGGLGSDIYIIDSLHDVVVETNAEDGKRDLVRAINGDGTLNSYTLGDFVENLILVNARDTSQLVIEGHGNALNNSITGNRADNLLAGGDGQDYLSGLNGNDTLIGDDGADRLLGGAGNDELVYDAADLAINGGTGLDTLLVEGSQQTLDLTTSKQINAIEVIDITGKGDNTLHLNAASVLRLMGQHQTLRINGNEGDIVNALDNGWLPLATITIDGHTYLQYTNGTAILQVESSITQVTLQNSIQDPNVVGHLINGTTGDDLLKGTSGKDTINGSAGNDTLSGGAGNDELNGGDGQDVFYVDAGTDTITDWVSTSRYSLFIEQNSINSDKLILLDRYAGNKLHVSQGATAIILGSDSRDLLSVLDQDNQGTIILRGGLGDDTLEGGKGNNILEGGAGNDLLVGRSNGNNTLQGGEGNDTLVGNEPFVGNFTSDGKYTFVANTLSNNTYLIDAGKDAIYNWNNTDHLEVSNGATVDIHAYNYGVTDWLDGIVCNLPIWLPGVYSWPEIRGWNIDVSQSSNHGTITIHGWFGADTLIGSNGNDQLFGYASGDILNGGNGNDTLSGGASNIGFWKEDWNPIVTMGDTLTGGNGDDTFIFNLTYDSSSTWALSDVITDFATGHDHLDVDTEVGTAANFIAQNGGNLAGEADVLKAAQTALDGTHKYFLAYNVNGAGYLYYDADGVDGNEVVIKLDGITKVQDFKFSDII